VPLGETYLELIAVVDEMEAASSLVGRWVSDARPVLGRPLGWVVRTRELDAVAQRLGLSVSSGSRAAPDGTLVRWRSAGIEQAAADSTLPFFIEWGPGTSFPGRMAATHPVGEVEIERLVLDGDAARLAEWLGDHRLPILVRVGKPAIAGIVLSGAGEIVVDANLSG
jgi:hypothetical protein